MMRRREGAETQQIEGCAVNLTKAVASEYIKDLKKELSTKTATEVSYRAPLKKMIESMTDQRVLAQIESTEKSDIKLILKTRGQTLSKWLGTIETKGIRKSTSRMTKLTELIKTNSLQLRKYLKNTHSIIFTNYLEFAILELDSHTNEIEIMHEAQIISPKNFESKNPHLDVLKHQELEKLFKKFIQETVLLKPITTQKKLACRLACSAKELSEEVLEQIRQIELSKRGEIKDSSDPVYVFYRQYKHLTRTENPTEIANAFGQTISCGLFLAKLNADLYYPNFHLTPSTAAASIPNSVPVIKDLFHYIGNYDSTKNISKSINNIIDTLEHADLEKIKNESPDIFLYFYEEFLKAFDKKTRTQMGVYYTPIEVVNYICEKVNLHLKNEFGRSFGFGDTNIRTLDPATGTGTFLVRAIDLAIHENSSSGGGGSEDAQEKLITENFIGFELLIPPYIIAHMKILSLLKQVNQQKQNVSIYLTNTLGSSEDIEIDLLGALAKEVKEASETKNKTRIMVVIGNPPWSAINKTKLDDGFINEKMDSYKRIKVPGMHSLGDPYVKFIRFAQYKIEQNGSGIVGMIVNNSFLNDMGFEGMRRELASVFDKIMIYNLHGNSKMNKHDENVFDITKSNTIIIMIKLPKELRTKHSTCYIEYDEIKGSRIKKFEALKNGKNNWKPIHPENTSKFLFIPHKKNQTYEKWIPLDQIFHEHFTGSNTHRDDFATAFDRETIKDRINDFLPGYISDEDLISKYDLKPNWELKSIRKHRLKVQHEGFKPDLVREYSYRPFDFRFAYFSKYVMGARRNYYDDVRDTLSICVPTSSNSEPWSSVHIAKGMADIKFCEYKAPSHMFPLRLKTQHGYGTKIDDDGHDSTPMKFNYNFSVRFIHFLKRIYDNKINGEDVFYYIYAILHSTLYRKKHTEYLQQGFPRIPFINNADNESGDLDLLQKISNLGKDLVNYHTMTKTVLLPDSKIKWIVGNTEIRKTLVSVDNGMVKVRFKNYTIINIPQNIWNYDIGSRKVLTEIIKSYRLKHKIELADRQHFLNVCGSIAKTIKIQGTLDDILYDKLSENFTGEAFEF